MSGRYPLVSRRDLTRTFRTDGGGRLTREVDDDDQQQATAKRNLAPSRSGAHHDSHAEAALLPLAVLALALLGLLLAAPPLALANHNPEAPTNLRTTSVAQNSIAVEWDAPSDMTNVERYWIRHKVSTESTWHVGFIVNIGGTNQRRQSIFNLSPGVTYDIEARSCQGLTTNHCSSNPATLQVTTTVLPSPPENVRIATFTFTSVTVAWDARHHRQRQSPAGALSTEKWAVPGWEPHRVIQPSCSTYSPA